LIMQKVFCNNIGHELRRHLAERAAELPLKAVAPVSPERGR